MEINVYEIKIGVLLLKDIEYQDSFREVANFIDSALAKNERLKVFHNENIFKNYVFNSLYPINKTKKKYFNKQRRSFIIRTIDKELAKFFKNMIKHSTDTMVCKNSSIKPLDYLKIEKIYSITPVIIKNNENGYWRKSMTIEEYKKRLKENLIKKYNMYTKIKINEDFTFIKEIKFMNYKPVSFKYKNVKLLGDKLDIKVDNNENAQLLAYMALGIGIGEINARGAGYLNYSKIKE